MQASSTWIIQVKLREHIVADPFPCIDVCYSNLPAKPAEEAQKHRQQYEEMVAQAKKRGEESRFRAGVSNTRKTSPPEGPLRSVGWLCNVQKLQRIFTANLAI